MSIIPEGVVTPGVLVDAEVLQGNIDRMAGAARARGLRLRPHVKTHKVKEIADLQLASGAVGLTVATVGEAEVFVAGGALDVFIAYPLWVDAPRAARLRCLAERALVRLGVDSAEGATAMGQGLGEAAADFMVLVEIDSGHHRSGVHPEAAAGVARAAADGGMNVVGVFTFPGHSYAPGAALTAAQDEDVALASAAASLSEAGFEVLELSGGSTPTALLETTTSATELRPGVYVFGDAQQLELGRCQPEDIALTVAATVVSRHEGGSGIPRRCILDAGSKVLGSDRPPWASGWGRLADHPAARITALSEHHATVILPDGDSLPPLGERLLVIPNHVCLTMNLVEEVSVVRGGVVVDRWAVAARGCNS